MGSNDFTSVTVYLWQEIHLRTGGYSGHYYYIISNQISFNDEGTHYCTCWVLLLSP